MWIKVTQEDIDNGIKQYSITRTDVCISCPVAQAFYRITGKSILVGMFSYWQWDVGKIHNLPNNVVDFVREFHNNIIEHPELIKPIKFQIKKETVK